MKWKSVKKKHYPLIIIIALGILVSIAALGISMNTKNTSSQSPGLPFYPSTSLHAHLRNQVGKEVFLIGLAIDTKGDPALLLNVFPGAEVARVYVKDIDRNTWVSQLKGKSVAIQGVLAQEKLIPDPQEDQSLQWTLTNTSYRLLDNMYSVNQIWLMQGGDLELQRAVIAQLEKDNEVADNFYVTQVTKEDNHIVLTLTHRDSLRPNKATSLGDVSGKGRVVIYDAVAGKIVESALLQ